MELQTVKKWDWYWPDGTLCVDHGPILAFDIETNGLLPDVNKLHSLVIKDINTGASRSFAARNGKPVDGYPTVEEGLALLSSAGMAFGHNVIGYDIPVLQHLYPKWQPPKVVKDTLLLAKMLWPVDALKEKDFPRWRAGKLEGSMIGAHRLEAWGFRLEVLKGDYSATVKALSKRLKAGEITEVPDEYKDLMVSDNPSDGLDPWLAWNKPMQDYCEQDVEVTHKLYNLIVSHLEGTAKAARGVGWSQESVELEHMVWSHCLRQEATGFGYDLDAAIKLTSELKNDQRDLEAKLRSIFGSWWEALSDVDEGELPAKSRSVTLDEFPDVTIERISDKTGKRLKDYVGPPKAHYSEDAPFVRIRRVTFNPKSRRHLGDRLAAVFGWQPTEWVGKNEDQAKVDETIIKEMEESILPADIKEMILKYLVVSKTLGQLADGRKSWNDMCVDGAIHGKVDPLGTVSHRGAHKDPNLGQVPSVSVKETKDDTGKVISKDIVWGWKGGYGAECRSLFRPIPGMKKQTGTDASGLELRMLGHYLEPYDGGAFATRVSTEGLDIHAENAKITGLTRAATKTTTYAFLYGAGNLKIGIGVGVDAADIPILSVSKEAKSYVNWMRKLMGNKFVMPDERTLAYVAKGSEVSRKFLEGITGLKDLKDALAAEAKETGFIIAIDGRKLHIRKAHAALNQLLQGGGAVVCKMWMIEMDRILREDYGLKHGVDYVQMAWVHDECQFAHKEGLEATIEAASRDAMSNVARMLDFKGKLTTESKSGYNWKDCH